MREVVAQLNKILDAAGPEGLAIRERLSQASFVEPFGWVNDALSFMLSEGVITLEQYHAFRARCS